MRARAGAIRNGARSLFVAGIAMAALVTGSVTAEAATISSGHIDAIDVDYVGGVLTLDIKTYSPVSDDVAPSTTTLGVGSGALTTVPSGSAFACLGTAGSSTYILPQSQNASLLWPGWNTEDVPAGLLTGDKVDLTLVGSTAPTGGTFALYTTNAFGTPTFRFNTNPATGCPKSVWAGISRNTHGHGNWAFSKSGTYTLTFKVTATTTAGSPVSSGNVTYMFVVG